MITVYQYFLDNTSKASLLKDSPGFISLVYKSAYILVALTLSFGLIYGALKLMGVFEQDASKTESWGNLFFNLIVFCAMLGIIYKLANAGGYLDKNPLYRLILNTLLYIPCLLVVLTNNLTNMIGLTKSSTSAFEPPKPFEIKMLVISLILLVLYFGWIFAGKHYIVSKYLKQGGKQLINQPIQTDTLTNVASYQTLSGTDKFDYRYAMSFWVYLDSFPPSTNSAYNKAVSLLSYGDNPMIKYSSSDNTIYITIKHNIEDKKDVDLSDKNETDEDIKPEYISQWKDVQGLINTAIENVKSMKFGNELDSDGNRILYKHPDVQLQKWNHIVLNYNGGTLDVFYNGKLVKSAINVVPYMKFDMLTVGTENGISGNIANLMYYNEPIDILTINTLYTSLKNSNPPVISDNNSTLLSPL